MIEIIVDKERNLKNLKQIGTPQEENKIYVENLTYLKMMESGYKDKRVFVLMGHTERMEGRYATFVEAAISVGEMEFNGYIPRWNNTLWSNVFREIKRLYEDMIIVGWALDVRGMSLHMTQELERVHREHFGGVHQLMLLMDSMEKEETFYTYKENKLMPKEGFYIYYHSNSNRQAEAQKELEVVDLNLEIPDINFFKDEAIGKNSENQKVIHEDEMKNVGRYRDLLNQNHKEDNSDSVNFGLAVAVALFAFVIGIGVYESREHISGKEERPVMESMSYTDTEETENNKESETTVLKEQETEDMVPVEIISGDKK